MAVEMEQCSYLLVVVSGCGSSRGSSGGCDSIISG